MIFVYGNDSCKSLFFLITEYVLKLILSLLWKCTAKGVQPIIHRLHATAMYYMECHGMISLSYLPKITKHLKLCRSKIHSFLPLNISSVELGSIADGEDVTGGKKFKAVLPKLSFITSNHLSENLFYPMYVKHV